MVQHLTPEWAALHEGLGGDLPERPGATARLQHVVTGGPEGEFAWTVHLVDGRVARVAVGRDDAAADCTFLIAHADAVAIATGALDLHAGYMQGRVKMTGPTGPLLASLPATQSAEYRDLLDRVAASTEV